MRWKVTAQNIMAASSAGKMALISYNANGILLTNCLLKSQIINGQIIRRLNKLKESNENHPGWPKKNIIYQLDMHGNTGVTIISRHISFLLSLIHLYKGSGRLCENLFYLCTDFSTYCLIAENYVNRQGEIPNTYIQSQIFALTLANQSGKSWIKKKSSCWFMLY